MTTQKTRISSRLIIVLLVLIISAVFGTVFFLKNMLIKSKAAGWGSYHSGNYNFDRWCESHNAACEKEFGVNRNLSKSNYLKNAVFTSGFKGEIIYAGVSFTCPTGKTCMLEKNKPGGPQGAGGYNITVVKTSNTDNQQ